LKAAQIGDLNAIIQEKTKENGNLNMQDEHGLTAVMVATKWNQVQALQLVSNELSCCANDTFMIATMVT
jgi:hypothetical protein